MGHPSTAVSALTPAFAVVNGAGQVGGHKDAAGDGTIVRQERMRSGSSFTAASSCEAHCIHSLAAGNVGGQVYQEYVRSAGGFCVMGTVAACVATSQTATVLTDMWLAYWSSHPQRPMSAPWPAAPNTTDPNLLAAHNELYFVSVYGALVGLAAALFLTRVVMIVAATARASKSLHDWMFTALLRAPQSFFDATPSGRIINRCGKDQEIADATLPGVIQVGSN